MILLKICSILKITTKPLNDKIKYHTFKPPWKILFFGTDNFSTESLKLLHSKLNQGSLISKLEIVTSTGHKKLNQVELYSKQNALQLHSWPLEIKPNEFDIGIVVSFGHLIPSNIIDAFPMGMLNVHASLLPRWRGAAPIIHAIANGDKLTGVSIMRIKPHKFDVGDILLQSSAEIREDMKMPDLYDYLAKLGAKTLVKAVENLPNILEMAVSQDNKNVTLAPRINSSFAIINWTNMTAVQIYNLERALYSLYGLTTTWNGLKVKLYNLNVDNENNKIENESPGFVCFDRSRNLLRVSCSSNTILTVRNINVNNKKTLSAAEFNNGYIKNMPLDKRLFK